MGIAWVLAPFAAVVVLPGRAQAAERFLAEPRLATDCQSALVDATSVFVQKKLKQLDKCAAGAFKCIQTVAPDDEAEEDPVERCLGRAAERCAKALEMIAREEQTLIEKGASPSPISCRKPDSTSTV